MSALRFESSGENTVLVKGSLLSAHMPQALPQCEQLITNNHNIFDFSAVNCCDSTSVALLIHCMRCAKRNGNAITFIGVPDKMLHIAQVSGVNALMPFA